MHFYFTNDKSIAKQIIIQPCERNIANIKCNRCFITYKKYLAMVVKNIIKKISTTEFLIHVDYVIDFISKQSKKNRRYFMNDFNILSDELKRRGL